MDEIIILIVGMIAGMITYIIANILKKGALVGPAVVTLVSGIVFPYFFPTIGSTLATVAACSSYAGMISVENALNLFEMAIISLMTGILFIAANKAYIGIGGRLGTMGAISCFAWLGFKKVFSGIDGEFKVEANKYEN